MKEGALQALERILAVRSEAARQELVRVNTAIDSLQEVLRGLDRPPPTNGETASAVSGWLIWSAEERKRINSALIKHAIEKERAIAELRRAVGQEIAAKHMIAARRAPRRV